MHANVVSLFSDEVTVKEICLNDLKFYEFLIHQGVYVNSELFYVWVLKVAIESFQDAPVKCTKM